MSKKTKNLVFLLTGLVIGAGFLIVVSYALQATSTNDYCMSCHYHELHNTAWKMSKHYLNESGTKVDCATCHLPSENSMFEHFIAKTKTGIKDLWSYYVTYGYKPDWLTSDEGSSLPQSIFKNVVDNVLPVDSIFINAKHTGDLDYARKIVYNSACVECHVNLFPQGLSDEGVKAHLYYSENQDKIEDLQCINCHLDAGHSNPNYKHSQDLDVSAEIISDTLYTSAAVVNGFEDFEETVPGTGVSFKMIAVPGGSFKIGSPENEQLRNDDEGPQKIVNISPFYMAETEVTWNAYFSFYRETMSEGRIAPDSIYAHNSMEGIDAVSGPTPPFGNPDQGWGFGDRPAITMTYYGAKTFCQWLSLKTGRNYRLPTEAEWEYAARGGTETPYFFDAKPKKLNKNPSLAQGNVIYNLNSKNKTALPSSVKPNPFGLKNMLGNALEYCSDWYSETAYADLTDGVTDPKGPNSGTEHVVRGGCYSDDASKVRAASRSYTHNDDWLKTDPQMPKSIWWYSDIKSISFRVVCEKN